MNSLNSVTKYDSKRARTCRLLCKRPGCYHIASMRQDLKFEPNPCFSDLSPDPKRATGRIKPLHNWWRIQPVGSVHRSQDTEEAKADKTRKGNKASTGSDYCKSEIFS